MSPPQVLSRRIWWPVPEPYEPIGPAEWRRTVASSSDLRPVGFIEATTPNGGTLRFTNDDLAVWETHPGGEEIPFDLRDGRVVVKNPDAVRRSPRAGPRWKPAGAGRARSADCG